MSDNGEVEVENPSNGYAVLPKEVTSEIGSVKLFNKWSYEDVEIRDISLTCVRTCIALKIMANAALIAITYKSAHLSTSHIPPVDMPLSDSARPSARSSSVSPIH